MSSNSHHKMNDDSFLAENNFIKPVIKIELMNLSNHKNYIILR